MAGGEPPVLLFQEQDRERADLLQVRFRVLAFPLAPCCRPRVSRNDDRNLLLYVDNFFVGRDVTLAACTSTAVERKRPRAAFFISVFYQRFFMCVPSEMQTPLPL